MPGFWEEYFVGVPILNWENLYFVLGLKGRQRLMALPHLQLAKY